MTEFAYSSPQAAIDALLELVNPVGTASVALSDATGRVLAAPLVADRDSPPCAVSAMDGFAVRAADCAGGAIRIAGAIRIGSAPPSLQPNTALRIVTGAAIPPGADAVVKHEDAVVVDESMRSSIEVRVDAHIRRKGENIAVGIEALPAGTIITPPVSGALATFGVAFPRVHRRVRVAIITSGDELVPVTASLDAWQLRDSNGAALGAMFAPLSFVSCETPLRVADDFDAIKLAVVALLARCDAFVLTGGVSMGERDFIPAVLRSLGVRVLFHRLPQRPGKPLLGGIAPDGQPVLALPGNPVSVLVTARRFAIPVLRRRAGVTTAERISSVTLEESDTATIPLWWHRSVRITSPGRAQLVKGRGSGDVPSAARSDGFIEMPPDTSGPGPWPFLQWSA